MSEKNLGSLAVMESDIACNLEEALLLSQFFADVQQGNLAPADVPVAYLSPDNVQKMLDQEHKPIGIATFSPVDVSRKAEIVE
mgnify:CR=1 FL=1